MTLSRTWICLLAAIPSFFLSSCVVDQKSRIIVSVTDQRLLLFNKNTYIKSYPISTSKFGLGDRQGSNKTPLGKMKIAVKIGDHQPLGMVFKSRRPTGEVIAPNCPGRDPIVSRIMWLRGMEFQNANTFRRFIYIHGTAEENRLGYRASYGCVRMSAEGVVDLYNRVGYGTSVEIVNRHIPRRDRYDTL